MKWILLLCGVCAASVLQAQKYFTKTAKVAFYSKAPLENIEAQNRQGVCMINAANGAVEFSVLMKGFQFKKAMMQEHFNDQYVESDKFPKAVFTGSLKNNSTIEWSKDGVYTTTAEGVMNIHGVSKPMTALVQITVNQGIASATTKFNITLSDYNIKIPALVKDNISKVVEVTASVQAFQIMK